MKKLLAVTLAMAVAHTTLAWGFLGHQTINRLAVYALPPELFGFYKKHIEYISIHSTDPDSRRYLFENEGCRHFLDCDHYETSAPIDTLPHNWYKALEMYGNDSLTEHGIVPWHCLAVLQQLTAAFREHNTEKILKYSADIGHYIADAHVPLHATGNYNGQRTGQQGIHALWESRLPKLYLDSFDLFTGTVTYLHNPEATIWNAVEGSFMRVDSVLQMERITSSHHPQNKYSIELVNNLTQKVYSENFCNDYNEAMNHMVARRMKASIQTVAAFWYTAWVDAGQPDLTGFSGLDSSEPNPVDLLKVQPNIQMKGRGEGDDE